MIKRLVFVGIICLLFANLAFSEVTVTEKAIPQIPHNLWPIPTQYAYQSTNITINDPCNFSFNVHTAVQIPQVSDFISLYRGYMFHNKGVCSHVPSTAETNTGDANSILNIYITDLSNILMNNGADESYTLSIQDGQLTLKAPTYLGFVRGMETFAQLLTYTPQPNGAITVGIPFTPINIIDQPRFTHRGIMIDTSRHFIPKEKLFQVMDAMVSVKLNVFHWHITDSDSFPIYIPSHPNLSKYGAFSEEETYTQKDVEDIVNYAILRGIKIIPEVDAPSHTGSWAFDPEFSSLLTCATSIWYRGIPFGQLDPTQDATYNLFADIFNDLKNYFPWDSLHLGSDEVFGRCWNTDPINAFMKQNKIADYDGLFNYFNDRARGRVDPSRNRVYWTNPDTAFLNFHSDDVLQWWGATGDLSNAMNHYSKNRYILSNYDHFYLDCGAGNYFGNKSWCDPFHSWLDIYGFEPTKILNTEQISRVLGLEAVLFSEMNDASVILNKIFPRTLSLAEKAWSLDDNFFNSNYAVFVRQNAWRKYIASRGIEVQPISAGYCEKHPDMCFI